jgi:hypothetical protein
MSPHSGWSPAAAMRAHPPSQATRCRARWPGSGGSRHLARQGQNSRGKPCRGLGKVKIREGRPCTPLGSACIRKGSSAHLSVRPEFAREALHMPRFGLHSRRKACMRHGSPRIRNGSSSCGTAGRELAREGLQRAVRGMARHGRANSYTAAVAALAILARPWRTKRE